MISSFVNQSTFFPLYVNQIKMSWVLTQYYIFSFPVVLICILVIYQNLSPGFGFSCWGYWLFFFKYSNFHCFAIILLVSSCFVYIFSHPPEQNKQKKSNHAMVFRPAYCSSHGVCASHSFFEELFTAALCFMRFNSSWPVSCYFFHHLWFFFLCYFFPF